MQIFEEQFLYLLKAGLNNIKLPDGYRFDVGRVFLLAIKHNLLPVIYSKAIESAEDVTQYKELVLRRCANQITKNTNFERLFISLVDNGFNVIVVKGPICALCYQTEHYRLSSDFDILVPECEKNALNEFLLSKGFYAKGEAYISEDEGLYVEVRTKLGEGNDRYAKFADEVFSEFFLNKFSVGIYHTLSYDEHFVYLLYHAFKHFIGSGFGVKQIADIYLYAKKYSDQLDFDKISMMINKIGIRSFSDNIFYLINKLFDYEIEELFTSIDESLICYEGFLADLLDAGVFGKSTEDRLHSASIVSNAVKNEGKKTILKTLFPDFGYMSSRFEILKKFPFLLLFFWIVRIFLYLFSAAERKSDVSPKKSIEIASDRIELMKKMGIL